MNEKFDPREHFIQNWKHTFGKEPTKQQLEEYDKLCSLPWGSDEMMEIVKRDLNVCRSCE